MYQSCGTTATCGRTYPGVCYTRLPERYLGDPFSAVLFFYLRSEVCVVRVGLMQLRVRMWVCVGVRACAC